MKNVNVRFPDDLHAQVKASAEASRRSFNSEVLWLIGRGLALPKEAGDIESPT